MCVVPDPYICAHIHYVFSTKNQAHGIPPGVQPELWAYIGGIARADAAKAIAVGGTDNHAHVLLAMPPILSIATAVQRIMDASSRWLHQENGLDFEWQEGYGAFTVSASQLPRTIQYINSQPEHHRRLSFENEFISLLRKHRIAYDPKCLFA